MLAYRVSLFFVSFSFPGAQSMTAYGTVERDGRFLPRWLEHFLAFLLLLLQIFLVLLECLGGHGCEFLVDLSRPELC
jgi:hypothetical protein